MEFHEKLQELRKRRTLTQEELAAALYVSRTAISKWESGRGYPSIDSLKEISRHFSVSIDDLLSGEKLLSIAENENKNNIRNMYESLFGIVDLFSFLLVILPLYPKTINSFVHSVNLLSYTETSLVNRSVYWTVFILLILIGTLKVLHLQLSNIILQKTLTVCSIILSAFAVIYLALAGETYAVAVVFLLLACKTALLYKRIKAEN